MKQLPSINSEIEDELIDKIFKNNFDILSPYFLKLMSEWTIGAYRVFKDILNRTHYRRLSKKHSTRLTLALAVSDTTLTVTDGTVLPDPSTGYNQPGVIFIGTERINYFEKSGNTLSRLVRGTLGTGVQDHSAGSVVVDGSLVCCCG